MSSPWPATTKRRAKEVSFTGYLALYILLFVSGCITSESLLHRGSPAPKEKVSWCASEEGVTLPMVETLHYAHAVRCGGPVIPSHLLLLLMIRINCARQLCFLLFFPVHFLLSCHFPLHSRQTTHTK